VLAEFSLSLPAATEFGDNPVKFRVLQEARKY